MNKLAQVLSLIFLLAATLASVGCASPQGTTLEEKRASVLSMRSDTMAELHRNNPAIEGEVKRAPGYAVFSNHGLKILIAGGGNGYGVVRNNKTGADTYMRMGEINAGLGIGVKDFRVLFVFKTEKAMNDFVESGWTAGASAEAGAKWDSDGGEVGKSVKFGDIDVYQITKSGVALQATLGGTKYWKDKDLNSGQ